MTQPITYYVLSPDDLERLVSDAAKSDRLVSAAEGCRVIGVDRSTFARLVQDGKITRQAIPGEPKLIRYSENQIRSIFKPIK